LWQVRDIDGSLHGFDKTFNHQLWFAAAASRLLDSGAPDLGRALDIFLDRLPQHLALFPNGLIYHDSVLQRESRRRRIVTIPTRVFGSALFPQRLLRHRSLATADSLYMKSVGYHAFCAYGFAALKLRVPAHPYWQSSSLHKVVRYLRSRDYSSLIDVESRYGFPYNAPGFEVPFAVATLGGSSEDQAAQLASSWVTAQAVRTLNPNSMRFERGTPDPTTLTARIYEMTGLSNHVLQSAVLGDLSSLAPSGPPSPTRVTLPQA
jgi:hypothetical protein